MFSWSDQTTFRTVPIVQSPAELSWNEPLYIASVTGGMVWYGIVWYSRV